MIRRCGVLFFWSLVLSCLGFTPSTWGEEGEKEAPAYGDWVKEKSVDDNRVRAQDLPPVVIKEVEVEAPAVDARPWTLSLEALGRAGLYSINLDRYFFRYFGVGAGFSYLPASSSGTVASSFVQNFLFPVYANFAMIPGNHRLVLSGGGLFSYGSFSLSTSFGGRTGGEVLVLTPVASVGYEWRMVSGFVLRANAYLFFDTQGATTTAVLPWAGLSAGWAF